MIGLVFYNAMLRYLFDSSSYPPSEEWARVSCSSTSHFWLNRKLSTAKTHRGGYVSSICCTEPRKGIIEIIASLIGDRDSDIATSCGAAWEYVMSTYDQGIRFHRREHDLYLWHAADNGRRFPIIQFRDFIALLRRPTEDFMKH